jgi:UTP--glucose-1-phosphate uridylyltransferase
MIRKAVIPAAGFGTRFLPASKSQPKEMLPIVDTPTIQYVVEEAVASGIEDILMIIGRGKRAIEEHFDRNFELEAELAEKDKQEQLALIKDISGLANVHFVWQKTLRGLGDAVLYAAQHVGREPFAVLLGDTIIDSKEPATKQLIDLFNRYHESIIALEMVDRTKVDRYGVIKGKEIENGTYLIQDFIEKPSIDEAPSNLAIAGRYIFTADIFDRIRNTTPGKNDEIQLTDAMRALVSSSAMYGYHFDGKRYDIGNKLDFLKTNIEFGLKRDDLGQPLREYIKSIANSL